MINESIFLVASERGELSEFIVGREPYFVAAKNAEDYPQNVAAAFDLVVYKLWTKTLDLQIPKDLVKGMREALAVDNDINRAIVCVSDWIKYYHIRWEKKINGNDFYSQIFKVDFEEVPTTLRGLIVSRECQLRDDRRWFGDKRYGDSGLWGPLIQQLTVVRDALNGPDLVPEVGLDSHATKGG